MEARVGNIEARLAKIEAGLARLLLEQQAKVKEQQAKAKKKVLNQAARDRVKAAKVAAKQRLLKNLDSDCLNPRGKGAIMGRDARLDRLLPAWAEKLVEFGKRNEPEKFLHWIAWKWNNDTYRAKPITAGQGVLYKFYGWSTSEETAYGSPKPMRSRITASQLFGKCARTKFTKVQAADFGDAPFWSWGRAVLHRTREEVPDEVWDALPKHFRRIVGLMCGGYGQVQLRKELLFDPRASAEVLSKTYRIAQPELNMGWKSIMQGLSASREPFRKPDQL